MALALFDLDRTLLGVNSGHLWLRKEWRDGRIGVGTAARAVYWLGRYALGDDRLDDAMAQAAAVYADDDADAMAQRVDAWFAAEVAHTVRPGAQQVIAQHRAQEDTLVLATTSSQWVASQAQDLLGFDDAVSTRLGVQAGRLTGTLEVPCHGPHKYVQARAWARTHGHDLADAWFYTDSYSDLPLLEAVGRPVVVHPDRRLRREAERRGWPVVDWGTA